MRNNDNNQIATAKASAAGMARGARVSRFQNTGVSRSAVRASVALEAIAEAMGDAPDLFADWKAEEAAIAALSAHLKADNDKTRAWVSEDPENRFAGLLSEDVQHWAEYGIYTIQELQEYLDR